MRPVSLLRISLAACMGLAGLGGLGARAQVPTPASVLGHTPGDDFYLADYGDAIHYFHTLAASSDRIKMFTVGRTTRGLAIEIAVISSPRNLAHLDDYKKTARQLATADKLTDDQARELARNSKVIVHIDGGLHSSEVAGGQHSIALAYKLLSAKGDPEIDTILDRVILVLWPTLNPDGQNMVVSWYRKNLGTQYEVSPMPWLFQDYVGHDNNRDGYMLNMKESQVVAKTEIEYSPAIFYCQHQSAPFPARIWIPPFSDPISTNISPYVRSWLNVIGTNMASYLNAHNMPGSISESRFDNWYPGFLDYTGVFRNEVSFFTETALYRYATPRFYTVDEFPKEYQDLRAGTMYTTPWAGGWWRLADAVRYMVGGSMSVLDFAAKNHEELLYNQYQAGRDNIAHYRKEGPSAYVIPLGQADVPEAAQLAGIMLKNGLDVYTSKSGFHANGMDYPAGSWVIPMDQPFSALAKELFEAQKYPTAKAEDLPYDVTGWTLPLDMGVRVDQVMEPVTPEQHSLLEKLDRIEVPEGRVQGTSEIYALSHHPNASFQIVNAIMASGGSIALAQDEVKTAEGPETGAFLVSGLSRSNLTDLAAKYGVDAVSVGNAPAHTIPIKKAKVGVYRPWDPSIDEGWTRWILENYGFKPISIYNADMHAANLRARFDTIILPDMSSQQLVSGFQTGMVPGQYVGGIEEEGIRNLREFVQQGGMLLAFNQTAAAIVPLLSLPVKNVLEGLRSDKFFCSGALLSMDLQHPELPVNYGLPPSPTIMFENGPAFELLPAAKGAVVLGKYPSETNPLESGLLLHPEAIQDKAAAVELEFGKGHIVLYGFKPQWRGQAHGMYKLFFNLLYAYQQPPLTKEDTSPASSGPDSH
jgi:hypothetical protein